MTRADHRPSPAAIQRNLLRLGLHRLLAQDAPYASQLGSPPKLSFLLSVVRQTARQHTLSLPLSNPSLSLTRFHSQLQTKCSFPPQHLITRTHSTSHTYLICQLTNGRAGRPRDVCIKMAMFRV